MARSESPKSGRGRTWPRSGGPPLDPDAPRDDPATYTPRRRYPWHDDPDYDPAAHRRTPPPQPPWEPPTPPHGNPPPTPPPSPTRPPTSQPGRPPTSKPTRPPTSPPGRPDPEEPADREPPEEQRPPRMPRKLTVTRVAALRGRQFTEGGIRAFRKAAEADGADRSGLTALTYATMADYAVDAAVAVALANTLFFAAATAESKANVALYLAITIAPFAVVAPVIGPLLDRLQRGRRVALAASFVGRALLCVVMAFNYETWLLYPAALGAMVFSKSCTVLRAAVTPRVLPERITLATTNSRLTTFGLVAGGVFGGIAAGVAALWGSPGALFYTAALAVGGTVLCLRIPKWVEVTEGEVPAALRETGGGKRRSMGHSVVVALWGTSAIRVLTGFLTLFVAFVVRDQSEGDPANQLTMIGIVGAAAGLGSFAGNAIGSRRMAGRSDTTILICVGLAVAVSVVAAVLPGIPTAAAVGLVGASVSALAKVCLDAVIQRDLPEESRASAFGRSETVLQLAWVFGGALGVLLPHWTFWIGFTVISCVVALAGTQTALLTKGRSMIPWPRRRAAASPATARTVR